MRYRVITVPNADLLPFPAMNRVAQRWLHRPWFASLFFMALCLRTLVPVGFMPAAGTPFALELCPEASPAPMPAHHMHHHAAGSHAEFAHCPFGCAPASGPISLFAAPEPSALAVSAPVADFELLRPADRFDHAHQARAPPHLA
jgi:hypothetical protein